MADKERLRSSIKGLQRVKTWQLVVILILFGFVAATFLRLNSIGMIERRAAVMSADKAGDERVLINRLYDLQRYVASHMNTDLGRGVYLEESYNRALQNWQETQYGDANPNGNIYKKVQEICEPQFRYYSTAYLQCTANELAKFPSAESSASDTSKPRQEAFVQTYSSPLWTPDFAGWSLLVCAFIVALILVRLISLGILKLLLNRHYRRV